jgi:hypothetical protein
MNCRDQLSKSKYIRLEAWTTPVVLHRPLEEDGDPAFIRSRRIYTVIGPKPPKWKFRAQVPNQTVAELELMENEDDCYLCSGILLGRFERHAFSRSCDEDVLLLISKRGEFWERIGIVYLGEEAKVWPPQSIDQLLPQPTQWWDILPLSKEVIILG